MGKKEGRRRRRGGFKGQETNGDLDTEGEGREAAQSGSRGRWMHEKKQQRLEASTWETGEG